MNLLFSRHISRKQPHKKPSKQWNKTQKNLKPPTKKSKQPFKLNHNILPNSLIPWSRLFLSLRNGHSLQLHGVNGGTYPFSWRFLLCSLSSKNATSFYSNIINIKWCYIKKKKKRDCLATLLPHGWKLKPSRICRISVRPEVWPLITKHHPGFFPEVRIFNQHRGLALLASSLSPTILLF